MIDSIAYINKYILLADEERTRLKLVTTLRPLGHHQVDVSAIGPSSG